jgi:hypothetical protein
MYTELAFSERTHAERGKALSKAQYNNNKNMSEDVQMFQDTFLFESF